MRAAAVNAVIILLVLLAAELIFGNWVSGPQFGFLNLPRNVSRTFDTTGLYEGGGKIKYTRDGYGLRGGYESPDKIDLLVMGGSTTNELYIDDAAAWFAVIAAEAAKDGRSLTVVNAGVDGQSSAGHLRNFEVWFPQIPGLKPRFILAYIGVNDIAVRPDAQSKFDAMASPETSRRIRHYIQNNSIFYQVFRIIRGIIKARSAKLVHGGTPPPEGEWAPAAEFPDRAALRAELADRLSAYAGRTALLAARIRAMGAEPVFVTQVFGTYRMRGGRPYGRVGDDGAVDEGGYTRMNLFNETMLAACRKAGAVCIDLASELEFQDGDFYDYVHTAPQGSARIGRYLYGKLKSVL